MLYLFMGYSKIDSALSYLQVELELSGTAEFGI
jgi:hypothetical protein